MRKSVCGATMSQQNPEVDKLEEYFGKVVSKEAFDFFAVFSRFEYAMKRGGFRLGSKAAPDWDKFASSLPKEFFEKLRDDSKALIFFDHPPDHLTKSDDGGVEWSKLPRVPKDTITLFRSLQTARNNLFHGDKKHDYSRDRDLMKAGLYILNTAYHYASQRKEFSKFVDEVAYGL